MTVPSLGWVPSGIDAADVPFDERELGPTPARRPEQLVLGHRVRVRDQGEIPCCTSVVVVQAMEVLLDATEPLSPLFHYHVARPDPTVLSDLSLRTALAVAARDGVAPLGVHNPPVTPGGARTTPSAAALERAGSCRVDAFRRMPDGGRVAAWRAALVAGHPVLFGFWATEEYESLAASKHDVLFGTGCELGARGHAALAIGYDDAREAFVVKDSRGCFFAAAGTWRLPYHLAASPIVHEAWTIVRLAK